MSGGYFNYDQYRIGSIADSIEQLIESNEINEFGGNIGNHYSSETIAKFNEAVELLRKAEVMAQRIDWLVECDDDEVSFHLRLKEDLDKLENKQ